jgi:ribosomal protein S10
MDFAQSWQMEAWDAGVLDSYCTFISHSGRLLGAEVDPACVPWLLSALKSLSLHQHLSIRPLGCFHAHTLIRRRSVKLATQIRRKSLLRSPFAHKKFFTQVCA